MRYHGCELGWLDGCRCDACRGYAKRVLGIEHPPIEPPRPRPKPDPDAARILRHLQESAQPRTISIHGVGLRKI
jgi:hypothetical protein